MNSLETTIQIGDHGFEAMREIGTWRPPAEITSQQAQDARQAIAEHDAYLRPAEPVDILGRVVTLLNHFFVGDVPPNVVTAMAKDWVQILAPYPLHAIHAACLAWLSTERRRPLPSDIAIPCADQIRDTHRAAVRLREITQATVLLEK